MKVLTDKKKRGKRKRGNPLYSAQIPSFTRTVLIKFDTFYFHIILLKKEKAILFSQNLNNND
jgi:hypothetical protein